MELRMTLGFKMAAAICLAGVAIAAPAHADFSGPANFPAYGADTGPAYIITLNPNATVTLSATGQVTYDFAWNGADDSYIGVINNSGQTVYSLKLSGTNAWNAIFDFETDGISTQGYPTPNGAPGNSKDATGYGGPDGYFTNISADLNHGTVNFIGGIQNGNWDYFSLESNLRWANLSAENLSVLGVTFSDQAPGPTPGAGYASFFALAAAAAFKLRKRFAL